MQVILMEKVINLGQLGDVVKVKNGFARNFLIPQGKAKRATEHNVADFAVRRAELEAADQAKLADAQARGAKLEGATVQIVAKGGRGRQAVRFRDQCGCRSSAGGTRPQGRKGPSAYGYRPPEADRRPSGHHLPASGCGSKRDCDSGGRAVILRCHVVKKKGWRQPFFVFRRGRILLPKFAVTSCKIFPFPLPIPSSNP